MSLLDVVRNNRHRLEEDLRDSPRRWQFSPARWLLRTTVIKLLRQHVRGDVLDVGCGQMPFRRHLDGLYDSYDGLDAERRSPDTRYLSDAQQMTDVPDDAYDTVLSVSVLEHLPHPASAIREMRRVCRPGGRVIICTPFLARFHEEPRDYFRYTRYALEMFAGESGMSVRAILPYGGVFTFLGHQLSTVVITLSWGVPILKWAAFWTNYWLLVRPAVWLDRVVTLGGKMPLGHFCVFENPTTESDATPLEREVEKAK